MLSSDRFGIDQESCCPGLLPGQMCPMHHRSATDRSTCKMESACAHHDAALLTLLAVGVLTAPAPSIHAGSRTEAIPVMALPTAARATHPDAPPPKPLV